MSASTTMILMQHLGLMALLAIAYAIVRSYSQLLGTTTRSLLLGLLFGGIASINMLLPLELGNGIIFDMRSIPLVLSAVFGGPWAAVAATLIITGVRIAIGGVGVIPAIVSAIGVAGISIAFWLWRQRSAKFGAHHLALAGALCIVPATIGLSILGFDLAIGILKNIGLSYFVASIIGGGAVGWLLLMEDRRRESERQLEIARETADKANQAKSTFLAQISHELRTPLSAILGSLDLLSMDRLQPAQQEMLDISRRSAQGLLTLLNDLLDLAKVEADRLITTPEPTDLNALLSDLRSLYFRVAQQKDLLIEVHLADDLPRHVLVDGHRLRQIVSNLLSNALKFTSRGFVELDATRVDDGAGGQRLRIIVRDSGIGIHPDRQQAVFETFEQAEIGTSRTYGGTGLGLAISRKLARAMGGDITVESTPSLGSCFTVDLPLLEADPTEVESSADRSLAQLADDKPLAGMRILLAEDTDANAAMISRVLTLLGADVAVAANGEIAIAKAADGFDVILMDMHMPVVDGMEATRRIRHSADPIAATPIFGLTADATPVNRRIYQAAGLDGVLTKPVDWPQLVEVIGTLRKAPAVTPETGAAAGEADPAPTTQPTLKSSEQAAHGLPVWNEETLAGLTGSLGRDVVIELLTSWSSSIQQCLTDIEDASATSTIDLTRVQRSAHALRGAAANFGFDRLHALADALQTTDSGAEAFELIGRLREEARLTDACVAEFTAGRPASKTAAAKPFKTA